MQVRTIAAGALTLVSVLSAQTTVYVQNGADGIGSNTTNSNVGIGTATPSSKLSVEGGVLSYDVRFKDSDGYVTYNLNSTDNGGGTSGALKFRTGDATERVRFDANGNVGIGTTNPGAPLQVRRAGGGGSIQFTTDNALGGSTRDGIFTISPDDGNDVGGFLFRTHNGSAGVFHALAITHAGNIGVGTTSPSTKLQVAVTGENARSVAMKVVNPATGSGSGAELLIGPYSDSYMASISSAGHPYNTYASDLWLRPRLGSSALGDGIYLSTTDNVGIGTISPSIGGGYTPKLHIAAPYGAVAIESTTPNKKWGIGVDSQGNLEFFESTANSYANRFFITNAGNVCIGTMAVAGYKLAVDGKIHAREIVVDSATWSDYVFADDYRLAPLSEVEDHIKAKKHLPGIPSAAEVEQGGVSLGDMQAKLLAKVEELTLHVISQNKRLDEQAARVAALEAENQALRGR